MRAINARVGQLSVSHSYLVSGNGKTVGISLGRTEVLASATTESCKKMSVMMTKIPSAYRSHRALRKNDQVMGEYETLICEALSSVLPERKVYPIVKIIVLFDDGGVLSAAMNACVLALMLAGVSLTDLPLCVTLATCNDTLIVDPQIDEEKYCTSLLTLAWLYNSKTLCLHVVDKRCKSTQIAQLMQFGLQNCVEPIYSHFVSCMKSFFLKETIFSNSN